MTIAHILRHKGHEVISTSDDVTIADVANLLSQHRIGAILVLGKAREILGIISERDIVRAISLNGADALGMIAGQIMTRTVRTAAPDTTVSSAMELMTASRFRHIPVVADGVLVGMVSIGDIVKARLGEQAHEVDSLRAYVSTAG